MLVNSGFVDVTSEAALSDAPEQQNRHCRRTREIARPAVCDALVDTSHDVDSGSWLNYVIWRKRCSWTPF
jgi:hypothetical protein